MMTGINNCGILGGDRRQIALAEQLAAAGFQGYICGFDGVTFTGNVHKTTLGEMIRLCNIIVLPLPVTDDGKHLKMDFSEKKIVLNDEFAEKMRGKRVIGGMMDRLYRTSSVWKQIQTDDYSVREEFAVRNAVPTAEGAIEIAMREYSGTVSGSRCLVAGFGRVGKVLSRMLHGLGAEVTVSARKPADIAWIKSCGYHSVQTENIGGGEYDIIFNTIPALIFDRPVLSSLSGCSLLIDLASAPGGVDYSAAEDTGIRALLAPSLPGRVAPKTAGAIILDTVCHIMEE
jgi:dipicolinate synthase subunit A